MNFKKGFKIKPTRVDESGVVVFTDGTNEVIANERACKAYGYKFKNGTCFAYQPTPALQRVYDNTTVESNGNNTIGSNTHNSHVQGRDNTLNGNNQQVLINGESHTANIDVSDSSTIAGRGSTLRANGQAILTSHVPNKSNIGECSVVILNCNTTDNSTTSMLAQIEQSGATGVLTDYIPVPNNSIVGIELYLTRLELGGSSGTAGNFSYRRQQSCIRVDQNGSGTITNFNTKNIAKLGVNGTYAITGVTLLNEDGDNQFAISVNVSDRNNVNNSWSGIMYLHILSTNVNF